MNPIDIRKTWQRAYKTDTNPEAVKVRRRVELLNEAKQLAAANDISLSEAKQILGAA